MSVQRVLVANHTGSLVGGAEQYVHAIVPALREAGLDVRMLTEDSGPPISGVPRWGARNANWRSEATSWKPDVAFIHGLADPVVEEFLVDSFPSVHFAHNYYGTCVSGEKRHVRPSLVTCKRRFGIACIPLYFTLGCGPLHARIGAEYARQARRHALLKRYRAIVVASKHMRNEFERNFQTPVVLASYFVPLASELQTARNANRFVFVGRMTSLKGGLVAVQAACLLRMEKRIDVELHFIGDGPERGRWANEAQRLGVRSEFHGWLDPTQRDAVLGSACALVVPSLWPEPFGMVGLEAGRLGIPSVGFRLGGIPEWLTDGVTGALCDPTGDLAKSLARGMFQVREDLLARNALGEGARRSVARFRKDEHVSTLLEVFDRARARRA